MFSKSFIALTSLAALAGSATVAASTAPFILRSSHESSTLPHSLQGKPRADAADVYEALSGFSCDWDSLVLVDIEGLKATDLPPLQTQSLSASNTLLAIPHVRSTTLHGVSDAATAWTERCSKELSVNQLDGLDGIDLSSLIAEITQSYSSHLLLIHGSPSLTKRQLIAPSDDMLAESIIETAADFEAASSSSSEEDGSSWTESAEGLLEEWFPSIFEDHKDTSTPASGGSASEEEYDEEDNYDGYYDMLNEMQFLKSNSTSGNSTAPLFERVSILSVPVITALLVSFGILIPILVMGVYALTTIQVPPYMMSIAKTSVSASKKDQ